MCGVPNSAWRGSVLPNKKGSFFKKPFCWYQSHFRSIPIQRAETPWGQRECRDGFRPNAAREHRPRTQGDGRREQPGERCFVRARRGGVLPNKKGSFFQGGLYASSKSHFCSIPIQRAETSRRQRECRDGFRPIEARRRRNSRAISRRSNEEPAETGRQAPQTPRRFCPTQYPTESGSGTRTISAPSARSLFSKLA